MKKSVVVLAATILLATPAFAQLVAPNQIGLRMGRRPCVACITNPTMIELTEGLAP